MYGIRNSQASLLAPTGTIGLMMDCDTTGIEPDLGLVKVKKLVGGGTMSIVNQTVPRALKSLGYTKPQIEKIIEYIDIEKTIIGAPGLKDEHKNVFACSMGDNAIHYMGHVKVMAAVQPFLSGAISKTVNMPEEASVEDVEQLHIEAWKMGLKAVAIYRDNCKVGQPLSMAKKEGTAQNNNSKSPVSLNTFEKIVVKGAVRRELPKIRQSKTFSFTVADSHGYITVGEYKDGSPGEIFVNFAKHGSTLRGIMDAFAISVSHGLQYGVPFRSYVKSFLNTSFAPSGITDDPEIRTASSIVDFIARRLALTYLSFDDLVELGLRSINDTPDNQTSLLNDSSPSKNEIPTATESVSVDSDLVSSLDKSQENTKPEPQIANNITNDDTAPLCYNCGNRTQRAGSCYVCSSCGSTTGCS